jgi:hypothetical protein
MLPFLKSKDDGVGVGPTDPIKRMPDKDGPSYDILDAIAEDMIAAVKSGKAVHLKTALQELISHIQTMDQMSDTHEEVGG